ncbi:MULTISPECIES: hypothetical protein [unclassified Janthinobacterium]|uniref:hypothetical protein n=1 Tax=unclassified Janthinobacterium TaxID=2610881 RepID=UPI001607899B|nr:MULTISPECIES: hypothetical protein [unclassified Janthinobacterium]MBB5369433.1 hypothetical protein [Janthinobacterium sp. K2C7]MBB5381031.1 hypothetical protein [Janthinobacterium sp. K2Li3]MBB5387816.1 hypothetical protein [Janthinobacterium sp. K2E3]
MQTSRRLSFTAAALAATALLTLACASSLAQAAPPDSVHVSVGAPYHVTAQEALDIENSYALSNQQILVVRVQDQHFFGRLANKDQLMQGQRQEVEIYAQAPGKFVTKRGASFVFSNAGEHVVIDDAQLLPGLRVPADSRNASTRDGSTSIRLVSR